MSLSSLLLGMPFAKGVHGSRLSTPLWGGVTPPPRPLPQSHDQISSVWKELESVRKKLDDSSSKTSTAAVNLLPVRMGVWSRGTQRVWSLPIATCNVGCNMASGHCRSHGRVVWPLDAAGSMAGWNGLWTLQVPWQGGMGSGHCRSHGRVWTLQVPWQGGMGSGHCRSHGRVWTLQVPWQGGMGSGHCMSHSRVEWALDTFDVSCPLSGQS